VNARRFRTVFGADLRFHSTRPLIWVLIVVLALSSYMLSTGDMTIASGDSTVGGDSKVWLTSEFQVALLFPLVAFLFYVFFVAVAAGMAIPRDDELEVGPVLHATRLTPAEYVWGKFLAVLLVFFGVLILHLLFQVLFNHLWPHAEAEKMRGPFQLVNYLRPALFLAVPCLVFFCGVSFAVGEATRKPILVFVLPVAALVVSIFFLFDWSPSWLDPRINRLLMWVEPSGFRWMNETWIKVDRGVDFYNSNPVVYDLPFLLSRIVYVLIGLGIAAGSARHFAATLRGVRVRIRRRRLVEPAGLPARRGSAEATVASLGMAVRPPGFVRTVLDVARFESRNLASQPGLYLFVPIILIQTIGTLMISVGAMDTPVLLTSGTAAVRSMNTLTLLVCLLLMFYTVESVLRERNTRLVQIFHATPSRTAALLFGKSLANGIVGAVVLLATMLGAWIVMLVQGKVTFDLRPFALVWGLLLVPTFLVWSSFVTAMVALTGSRYATYAVALGTLILTGVMQMKGKMTWVGNWDLWSVTTWTDFGNVQPNVQALLLNRLFWLAVMVFLIALTVRVFPRREHDSAATLDRLRPAALLRTAGRLSPFAAPALVLGIVLFAQVRAGWQGAAAEKRARDYWARNVATWAEAKTPHLGGVDLDVELEPAEHRFRVHGRYDLVNWTEEAMTRFPMSVGDHFGKVEWTLGGKPFEPENRAKLFVFEPAEPLAPGDTVRVGFSYDGQLPRGISKNGGGMGQFVLPAGVVLTPFGSNFLPVPDFEEGRGVERGKNDTEPRDWAEGFWEGVTPPALGSGVCFPVRTRITGPAEYDYHGVGVRTEETVENGHRTIVWESDHPVNFFNIVAGKWDVWEGDGVAIYHHPDHTYNLEAMGEALEAARRYYSEWFHPYPWKELRINEFPGIASYAQGFPTNITFSEQIGFLTRATAEADAPFLVTAHETAHQWWGNIVMPGEGPGGEILSEGMAHFSTILLFGQVKGERGRRECCKRIESHYGDERRVDSEKPLVWTLGDKPSDTTVMYDKGGWVFWMLHRLLGEEAGFAGIREFVDEYSTGPDFPVLQDYVRVLLRHAPDEAAFDDFVDQWFLDVVVPEYRIEGPRKSRDGDGWLVTATVVNRGSGRMPVDVAAVRGKRPDERDDGAAESEGEDAWRIAREPVLLGAGESAEIEIRCDFEPERLVVDPDVTVLMLERDQAVASL